MAERAQKLQRLNQLRRSVPYVSQSALAAILLDVKEKGVPELHQRKAMQEATSCELAKLDAYGPLIQTVNGILKSGDTVPVLLVNPLSYIHAAVHQGGSYTELMMDTHRRCPSSPESPWQLIVYSDEVVPGNVLAARNERKTWAIYGSFMQHGQVFLQKESAWMVLLCKRTSSVDALDGGISQLVAMVLKMIFVQQVLHTSAVWNESGFARWRASPNLVSLRNVSPRRGSSQVRTGHQRRQWQ